MDHIEMVENLRNKTNVSYSDAKEALEKSNWDMLDAMIILENNGKTEKGTSTASSTEKNENDKYEVVAATASLKNDYTKRAIGGIHGLILKIAKILTGNSLIVRRKGENIVKMPLILLALLCCACVRFILVIILAGLFIGCSYYIEGCSFSDSSSVNKVMKDVNDSFEHMMNKNSEKDD